MKYRLTRARVICDGLTIAALGGFLMFALEASGDDDSSGRGKPVEQYRVVWERSENTVELSETKAVVADLSSAIMQVRTDAVTWLRGKVGLDFGFDPLADIEQREHARLEWDSYVKNLETAIAQKIPRLLEVRTPRNKNHRAWAAMFLGESAPHPSFLPLLREVVANKQEDYFTRYWALTAISQIPHDDMIEFLIQQLDTDLAGRAWSQLGKLTGSGIQNDKKDWLDVKERYEAWWAKNRTQFKYERIRALIDW